MFKPGQSGNPTGRTRTRNLSLGELLRRKVESPKLKGLIAGAIIDLATKGESEATRLQALKMIFESLEGKPAPKAPEKAKAGKLEVVYTDESNDKTAAAA